MIDRSRRGSQGRGGAGDRSFLRCNPAPEGYSTEDWNRRGTEPEDSHGGEGGEVESRYAGMYHEAVASALKFSEDVLIALQGYEPDEREYIPDKIKKLVQQHNALRTGVEKVRDGAEKDSIERYLPGVVPNERQKSIGDCARRVHTYYKQALTALLDGAGTEAKP